MAGRPEDLFHCRAAELPVGSRRCPQRPTVVHRFGLFIHTNGRFPGQGIPLARRWGRSVGVDQLSDGGNLPPQLIVDGRLAGDLVAGMEDG
jgi:hypothetical protein